MENESWKTIEDYEDYQISNLGKVKNIKTSFILKSHLDSAGYEKISLSKNKRTKTFRVHRLIALYFIPNPENKKTVNHKNNIRNDNRIENLEWATMSEQNLAINKSIKTPNSFSYKADSRVILRVDPLNKNVILEKYNSIKDASKWIYELNLSSFKEFNKTNSSSISSKICAVCNNKRKIAYGFSWKYHNENEFIENEVWKEIPLELTNGNSNYFISSLGRFKNTKGQIIDRYNHWSGYKRFTIKNKTYLLHRLVAMVFILNPHNKEQVNHKNGNKLDNRVENLEWVTNQENQIHKIDTGLYKGTKQIHVFDKDMNFMNEYKSIIECSKELLINASVISDNCRGKTTDTKSGYKFRYA